MLFKKNQFLQEVTLLENGSKTLSLSESKRWSVQYDLYAMGLREAQEDSEDVSYIFPTTAIICEGETHFVEPMETMAQLIDRYHRNQRRIS